MNNQSIIFFSGLNILPGSPELRQVEPVFMRIYA